MIGFLMKKSPEIESDANWLNFHPINQFLHEKSIENGFRMIRLDFGLHSWWSVPLMNKSLKIENVANWSTFHPINQFLHEKSIENGFRMLWLDFTIHSWSSVPLIEKSPKIESVANWLELSSKPILWRKNWYEMILKRSDMNLAFILDQKFPWWKRVWKLRILQLDRIFIL